MFADSIVYPVLCSALFATAIVLAVAALYLAARRWRADLGLPDYVFVKTVAEVKPIFIDMTSPVSVSVLAATLRAARAARGERASFVVTEMLPEPGEMWVCDAAGQRYAAELRLHIRNDLFQDDL